jgi:hypothetical protein
MGHKPLHERSGWSRDRTGDTRIFSPLLYQLSYPAINLVNNNLQTVNFALNAILIPQSDTTSLKI